MVASHGRNKKKLQIDASIFFMPTKCLFEYNFKMPNLAGREIKENLC